MTDQYVWSYNNDPYKKTKYFAKCGDKIQWKRNGSSGYVLAEIIGYDDTKPKKVLVQNLDRNHATIGGPRWINRKSVLTVLTTSQASNQ